MSPHTPSLVAGCLITMLNFCPSDCKSPAELLPLTLCCGAVFGCAMPNEGNQGKDSDCPVNATADGTLANPGVDPEFCDKVGRHAASSASRYRENEDAKLAPEAGPTSALYRCPFLQGCTDQLASFGSI